MKWKLGGMALVLLLAVLAWAVLRMGSGIDSAEALSRLALNALVSDSGQGQCDEYNTQGNCSAAARISRALGLLPPPMPAPVAVGNALSLQRAMESIHLLPLAPRGNDLKPEDSLLVRVSNRQMWLDFAGKNRAGRELKVSIQLDSAGGTPVKLLAQTGSDSKEVQLLGTALTANDRRLRYLVPEPGADNPKFANWLTMPNDAVPKTYVLLAIALRNTAPEFIPQIAQVIYTSIAAFRAEDTLGLYPELRNIDQHAAALRAMNAAQWLPQEQLAAMVNAAYPQAPAARAAWALAICESIATFPVIDENCWYRLTADDAAVNALLSAEVVQLQALYSPLEPGHPLRIRLDRLGEALHKAALKKAALATLPVAGS